ncbi:hypothetical protein VOLCADRAFT_95034 [Volvox carteri f. nagariensis]|uniref:Uncharacterized protein n=1 Tax=Volvox carteri f. nagariensis TaxID=3068 RepID=D8U6F3_VOLCA|nr:uncharacterized protein VOLCADRAFT_95034 [Volvox carteri f. nagariensis]EFJ44636.1 hypothetical protein VOLCADRAFT_95034 [Volvox carteri f. nagariensis]|eukprot:XP_002954212.1 hypothetical protein VOLCADRAFT_95034 [Volvox carteri f. nagariensis]
MRQVSRDPIIGLMGVSAPRGPAGVVTVERLKMSCMFSNECPPYKSIQAKYDGDLVFKGRSMRTIMTEAPPLALARYLGNLGGQARCAEALCPEADEVDDDDLLCTCINFNTTSMAPPAFMDTPALVCGT